MGDSVRLQWPGSQDATWTHQNGVRQHSVTILAPKQDKAAADPSWIEPEKTD